MEQTLAKLKKIISTKRFVNCHSREFSPENPQFFNQFLSNLKKEYKNICVGINIRQFENCETEEQEALVLLELINKQLVSEGLTPFASQKSPISIANALSNWGNSLEGRALLVFHSFHDLYSEKEKNVLRSLRKTIRNKEEIKSYLALLIISNRKVSKWELFPESNLDERHVFFSEFKDIL